MSRRSDSRGLKGDPMYGEKYDYEDEDQDEDDDDDDPTDLREILGSKVSSDSEDNESDDAKSYTIGDRRNSMLDKIVEYEDEENEEEVESEDESNDNESEEIEQAVFTLPTSAKSHVSNEDVEQVVFPLPSSTKSPVSNEEVEQVVFPLPSSAKSPVSCIPPPPSTKPTLPSIPPPPSMKPVLPSASPPPTSNPSLENTTRSENIKLTSDKIKRTSRRKQHREKKSISSDESSVTRRSYSNVQQSTSSTKRSDTRNSYSNVEQSTSSSKSSDTRNSYSNVQAKSVSQASLQSHQQQRTDNLCRNSNPTMAHQNSIPQPCECPRSHEEITEEIMGLAMEGSSRDSVRQIGQWILQGHDVNASAGTTTLLDTACNYCFLPLLEALVASPHLHLNNKDHLGRTPLMMASIWYDPFNGGTSEQAVDLITTANGDCVLDYAAKDTDGKTALIHAAENKRWGSVIILLERFKMHEIRSLVTAMFLALEGGAIDVVRYMQKNYKERLEKVSLQTAASLYVDKMGYATS